MYIYIYVNIIKVTKTRAQGLDLRAILTYAYENRPYRAHNIYMYIYIYIYIHIYYKRLP